MAATKSKPARTLVANNWLDISTEGFAAENAGRPRPHLAKEPVQNGLDAIGEAEGNVDIRLSYDKVRRGLLFVVTDDGSGIAPEDLEKIRTVFWTSKKDSVLKRGRMGRGFKEMLCMAMEATVHSGKAQLGFVRENGEQQIYRQDAPKKLDGTQVSMLMPWPETAIDELEAYFQTFLPPDNINLAVNSIKIARPYVKHMVEVSLPTEMFQDGTWVRPSRKTTVELVHCRPDQKAMIYEMGIPVCEIEWDFPYHANVKQRVPMNPKRDAVMTGYARKIHAAAIPILLKELTKEQVLSDVVGAVAPSLEPAVQQEIIRKGLGDNVVRQVPALGRRDFNDDAKDLGFTPINTNNLSGGLREIVKTHVASAKDVVDRENLREQQLATSNAFTVEDVYAEETRLATKRRAIIEALGKKRVEDVVDFGRWLSQRLLDIYPNVTIAGIQIAVFPDNTIATWDDRDNLTLGLNHRDTFDNPLGRETLRVFVHEVAHHLNLHHSYNFHKEVEVLSGQLGVVMFENADLIRQRWPELVKTVR